MTTVREADWVPPELFHEYRIVRLLGRGAMGQVFLGVDTNLDRPVALKFIAQIAPNQLARERFLVEARAAARLQHPNVVAVYRVGELGTRPYLVSEFVRGTSLDKSPRPMPWRKAWEIGLALARGLAAAHRRGVLHRDIKPANAMITEDGEVKLLDFGLAKLLETAAAPRLPHTADATLPPDDPARTLDASNRGRETRPSGESQPVDDLANDDTRDFVDPAAPDALDSQQPSGGELTQAGAMMGTPFYMSPEAWRGEAATRRSDVYSLGVLLYELVAGAVPHRATTFGELRELVQSRDATPLRDKAADCDGEFAAIVDRCLRRDPEARYASGDDLREALEQLSKPVSAAVPPGNPYRGLAAFESEHRALFFGRAPQIRQVIERLKTEALVVVAGESGVGKSSLCRAGVLPAVIEGALGDGRSWSAVRWIPGSRPLATLTAALAEAAGQTEAALAASIREEPGALGRELRGKLGAQHGLLVLTDQLEELSTLSDPAEAEAVAAAISALAVPSSNVRVLATVRSDFLGRVARMPALRDDVARGLYLLGPLGSESVRDAIVGPARMTKVTFESDDMVDELVKTAAERDGALPLLQFALAELWEARDVERGIVTRAALASLGGVSGALARHADGVLAGLSAVQKLAARRVLTMLVTADNTRARRTEVELVGNDRLARTVIERLVRGRLLLPREELDESAYEVAHEALITEWGTLRTWLHDDSEQRALRERIAQATAEWERLGHTDEGLWRERQLRELDGIDLSTLRTTEAAFATASRRLVRRRKWLRGGAIAAVPVAIVGIYAAVQLNHRRDLDRRVTKQLRLAQSELDLARTENRQVESLQQRAFERFDANDTTAGEKLWATALADAKRANERYATASQAAETALMIDASRVDSRRTLADILYERALIAEREHRGADMAELLGRMQPYDDGTRAATWKRPGTIAVRAACESLAVERFVEDPTTKVGRWDPVETKPCPSTLELPPASYLLTLKKPGHVDVKYPVLLARGETVEVAPRLPLVDAIPPGFVYVPGGRFLRGSTSPEGHRIGFERAAPLHASTIHSFAIAIHELTYREWIAFLDSLPPEEQAKRLPKASSKGLQGFVALARVDRQWQLEVQPGSVGYVVKEGERLRYSARTENVEHDWYRLPVTGITREDIDAFIAWYRTTNAAHIRLCTDEEWEFAARGADGRLYPHGNRLLPQDANVQVGASKSDSMGPDQVGGFPRSKSIFGTHDMAGNVFELVVYERVQAVRGGSYNWDDVAAQIQSRSILEATFRDVMIGARLCMDR